MQRRELLSIAAVGATSGCVAGYTPQGRRTDPAAEEEVTPIPLVEQGIPSDICEESLEPEGFLAVDDPAFGSPDD